jgi:phosphatidylinositol dimannoside acyltransferase
VPDGTGVSRVRDRGFDRIGVSAYRAASLAAQNLPEPVTSFAASMLGVGFGTGMRGRRSMIERHLRRVDPTLHGPALRRASQAAFDYYARYWVESFRLPGLSAQEVDSAFSYDGLEYVDDALAGGRGVLICLPHLGGWEWAGRWLAEQGVPITVVVEPLDPPELFEWFVSFRRSLGMTVVPMGPDAGTAVLRALRTNGAVCLLCDRDIQGGGVEVEFFGEGTTLPAGPATLSLRTGAPILPCAVYFRPGRESHHAIIRPPVPSPRQGSLRQDVTRITQTLATELEVLIRAAPAQWHLFQPNWPSDPGYAHLQGT